MSEWFHAAFGEDYTRLYAHRDESEAADIVSLILKRTKIAKDALVLDGPCGAGRHIKAFAAHGIKAYGFDLSSALLAETRSSGVAPSRIVRADLRALPYRPKSFDLVVNLFSSLGYFDTDDVNFSVLRDIVSLCRRGGWVVVDFMNSNFVWSNLQKESSRITPDGMSVHDRRWIEGTPPRVNKHTAVLFPNGSEKVFQESVRLFSPNELRCALADCGVSVEEEYGSYTGEPFSSRSQRIILVGRRN